MLNVYLIVTSLFSLLMGVSWSKKDFPNIFLKAMFWIICLSGLFLLLKVNGYIVKV